MCRILLRGSAASQVLIARLISFLSFYASRRIQKLKYVGKFQLKVQTLATIFSKNRILKVKLAFFLNPWRDRGPLVDDSRLEKSPLVG